MGLLNVAHVCLSLDVGGLERLILGLTQAGVRGGQRVRVVCLDRPGALAGEVEAAGAGVICLGKRPGLRPVTAVRLARVFAREGSEIVHTHQIGALLYAGPAAAAAGVGAVVHTEHGNHLGGDSTRLGKARARILWSAAAGWADRFACVSADIAAAAAARGGVPRRKLLVVPNGVDTEPDVSADEVVTLRREFGWAEGTPVVGTVGRLAPVKRQEVLIRAFAELRRRHAAARLLLVGEGPERPDLEALAREMRVADAVAFAGQRSRPEPFYRLMTVFTLTSRSEGMPVSLLEAWAAGVPAVCTAVGGVPEMIADGRTGFLVPPDDPGAVAAALDRVLSDPALGAAVAASGRQEVRERYGRAVTAGRYAELYQTLLTRGKPCGFSR
jgi:glycosyltransferase involved in cell wall biosynthesis